MHGHTRSLGQGQQGQPPTTLSLDLALLFSTLFVVVVVVVHALHSRSHTHTMHATSPVVSPSGIENPGALQKFLAFFLFRLGPCEAFHALFLNPMLCRRRRGDRWIYSPGSPAKQTSTGKDSFPWHVYRRFLYLAV